MKAIDKFITLGMIIGWAVMITAALAGPMIISVWLIDGDYSLVLISIPLLIQAVYLIAFGLYADRERAR